MSHMKPYLREALDALSKQTRSYDVWIIFLEVYAEKEG